MFLLTYILSLLKSYWKPLLGGVMILALLGGVYFKGRSDANAKAELKMAKDLEKRMEEYRKTIEHDRAIEDKIDQHRINTPSDDYDSCILSTDPLEDKCK